MRPTSLIALALAVLFAACFAACACDAQDEGPGAAPAFAGEFPGVRFENAFPRLRLSRPLWIGAAPDGSDRLFVLEQDGIVRSFENRPDVRASDVVLDLRDKVSRGHNEEGLLGMAFHPRFAENRRVFLHYSESDPRRGVVSEFRMDPKTGRIPPKSERVVLEQRQPWGNHNGGCIAFGPDGFLYVSFGDGGAANDPKGAGQDLSTWLGSILRIDVDGRRPYTVPKDNPFVGRRGAKDEIWAYGLRNVWRFAFDPVTGTLWGGDVGQNAWEEIDVLVKGGNYGWAAREGLHRFGRGKGKGKDADEDEFIDPLVEHPAAEARSITGGVVYRGRRVPGLHGAYVYADYATGGVWALRWDGNAMTDHTRLGQLGSVASFGTDREGEVYAVTLTGTIHHLTPTAPLAGKSDFPPRLSETGVFVDTAARKLAADVVPYEINVPLWSDGAAKERALRLPKDARVGVDAAGRFSYPEGTLFVKTFLSPKDAVQGAGQPLETRLLVLREGAWAGHTYVWTPDGQDAVRIDQRFERPYRIRGSGSAASRDWMFPGPADCASCHTAASGSVLGFRSEQLDRDVTTAAGSANQLGALAARGLFEGDLVPTSRFPDWSEAAVGDERALRAYLDVNCANCHLPGGPGNAAIDLRASTPLAQTGLVGAAPGHGDLGVKGARVLKPGDPKRSLLWLRMMRLDEHAMPRLGRNAVDERATRSLRAWIRSLR